MVTTRDPFAGGGGGGGGGTPFPGFATTAQAQLGAEAGVASSPVRVAQYVRQVSNEENFTGFTRYTGTIASIGLGQFGFSAAPANPPDVFAQTVHLRAHNATEHANVLKELGAGSYLLLTQTPTINTESRIAVAQAIPVPNSDVPRIQALAVSHIARGTFGNDVNCTLDVIGAVKSLSLKSYDHKFQNGNDNLPWVSNGWISVPHRAGQTTVAADAEMELYMSSRATGIMTGISMVTGWVTSSGDHSGHLRVQYSTDSGSTWTTAQTITNAYNANIQANLPITMTTVLRPRHFGKILVRWQAQRVNGTWGLDAQSAFAQEV